MARGVVYLDIDDEITSAAARVRTADGRRVALVLPYGSRLATSRINFRLLARDATTHQKRLAVIAGDPATRALAASAGLPIFATVGEYEASVAEEDAALGDAPGGDRSAGGGTAAAGGLAASATVVTPETDGRPEAPGAPEVTTSPVSRQPAPRERVAPAQSGPAGDSTDTTLERTVPLRRAESGLEPAGAAGGTGAGAATAVLGGPATPPIGVGPSERDHGRARLRIGRGPILVALGVLALALVVGGVAAYLLLPSATIAITPREETIGPVAFQVTASTTATEPDPEAGIVPAVLLDVDVEVSDTFEATGRRVEEETAQGRVRFDNLDPTTSNRIAAGAVISTGSGVRFRTDRAIEIPPAKLTGLRIEPSSASVGITAVDPGPEGNVQPNAITTVPRGEEPIFLKVTNPDGTSGGTRTEFPRVRQDDVDLAVEVLTASLATAFAERLEDPELAGEGAAVFPETAKLGEPTFTVDLEELVGEELESFELGASARGTVTAVDPGPVASIAERRLTGSVEPGYQLVDDSSEITVDPAVLREGAVRFPVTVTARQVRVLDPAEIQARIVGLPVEEARAILEGYGTVDLQVWPDWVATIPTLDGRVSISVDGPTTEGEPFGGEESGDGGSPRPSGTP